MYLFSLLLGSLALAFPALALIGLMMNISYNGPFTSSFAIKKTIPFFLPAILILLVMNQDILIPAVDAILGTGLVMLIFLFALKSGVNSNSAFSLAALGIVAYGMMRMYIWGSSLGPIHHEALELAFEQMRQMQQSIDESELQTTLSFLDKLWPAQWMITQILAFFLGFWLFKRSSGIGFSLQEQPFPAIYNLSILLVLPLYLIPQAKTGFFNALAALCVLPFIQGMALLSAKLAKIIENKVVRALIIIFLLLNFVTYILIILFGFAKIWQSSNTLSKGDTHQ